MIKAHSAPWPWHQMLMLAAAGLIAFANHAQTVAPGLAHTPQQMAERLVELAEGPPPLMADLEREFGFTFVRGVLGHSNTYRGRAEFPFAPLLGDWDSNIAFHDFEGSKSYAFRFITAQQQFELRSWYCLQNERVLRRLGNQWERRIKDGGGHFPTDVTYTRQIDGVTRRISVSPVFLKTGCLNFFSIDYDTSKPPVPGGIQK